MSRTPWRVLGVLLCGLWLAAFSAASGTEGAQSTIVDEDGYLVVDHPAFLVQQDPLYPLLLAALETEPGFLGMAPAVDGSQQVLALFEGDAPVVLPEYLVPDGWVLEAHGNLEYEPLMLVVDTDALKELEVPLDHGPPVPEDSIGIGPGSTLYINFDGSIGGCTAAFIMRDRNTGRLYLSAAGHCFPDATRVRVCVENCVGGLTGLLLAAQGMYPGVLRDIGVGDPLVDYFIDGGVGTDFGIVEIPFDELCSEIRTDMPVWNGPHTSDTDRHVELGDVVVHYGNGVALGEVFPTKARAGLGMGSDPNSWQIGRAHV